MVKNKQKKSNKNKQVPKSSRRAVRGMSDYYVDGAAMAHAKLMADPCGGRLVPPAYPQPGGGAIQRFRAIASYGTGAGDTAVLFHWTPTINEFIINAAVSAATAFVPNIQTAFAGLSNAVGVGTSALNYRVIAACVRVLTNASEANRAGLIYAGQTSVQYLGQNAGATTSVAAASASLPITARVPSKHLEVLWTPALGDQSFVADYTGVSAVLGQASSAYSSITVGASGLPAGTGLTFELTLVAEINYNSNGNVVATPPPVTTTPWNNVLRTFSALIKNAPVIVDTARETIEYFGIAKSSQPGRPVAGGAQRYITM